MFTVYVLYSKTHDKIYVGLTSNLIARFHSHNKLATKGWTIKFRPWSVVYTEVYEDKGDGSRREKSLKSARGRKFIREDILPKYLNS
jgi:putative endonuclease